MQANRGRRGPFVSFGLVVAFVTAIAFALWLALASDDAVAGADKHQVHVGWLLGSPRIAAVAIDVGKRDKQGSRSVAAYVCDGLGSGDGIAVWFKGSIAADGTASLHAPGGATLEIQSFDEDFGGNGVFIESDGKRARFDVAPAQGGAGIYDVTLDHNQHYSGRSTDGAVLDAQINAQGRVVGTIRHRGDRVRFNLSVLALLPVAELTAAGFPATFTTYAAVASLPGSYVAVITPGGRFWMGRSGAVRAGAPGAEIIGLDKSDLR